MDYSDELRKKYLETLLSQYSRIARKSGANKRDTEITIDELLDEFNKINKKKDN